MASNVPIQIVLEPHEPHQETSSSDDSSGHEEISTSAYSSHPPSMNPPVWTHRVSASFNAVAHQIAAASQAIAMIPPMMTMGHDSEAQIAHLSERLDGIEKTQEGLAEELRALKEQLKQINEGPEKFEKKLVEHIATFKLEQQRLPARLHNSMVSVNKMSIKPVIMANGKFPAQFPATRGEFEHLTKERYEALMKSYDLPIQGDLVAKRDTVRSFIGVPQ